MTASLLALHAALGPHPPVTQMRDWVRHFEVEVDPLLRAVDDRVILPNMWADSVARVTIPPPDVTGRPEYTFVLPGSTDVALVNWSLDIPFRARIEVCTYFNEESSVPRHEKYIPWAGRVDPEVVFGRSQLLRAWAALPALVVELDRVLLAAAVG